MGWLGKLNKNKNMENNEDKKPRHLYRSWTKIGKESRTGSENAIASDFMIPIQAHC